MKIATKKGDAGITTLFSGARVRKDDIRIDTCGMLDELCSFLGLAKSMIRNINKKKIIESIQKDLFILGAELATPRKFIYKLKNRIDCSFIERLDGEIEKIEGKIKLKNNSFLLPGENVLSGCLDVARVIARKSERKAVTLSREGFLKNKHILIYLNRLSDLLYLLARSCEKKV
jgi:cob(I)alamin adenosyltransferase